MSDYIAESFSLVCDLGLELGVRDLSKKPGLWEQKVDEHWWFALNPHAERITCSHGGEVPPYCLLIEFNGWPAGFINAAGGSMAAGALANEDTFIAALKEAIKKAEIPA